MSFNQVNCSAMTATAAAAVSPGCAFINDSVAKEAECAAVELIADCQQLDSCRLSDSGFQCEADGMS